MDEVSRIAFVTRRYAALQGLSQMVLAAWLMVLTHSGFPAPGGVIGPITGGAFITALVFIRRYYERRFGRTRPRLPDPHWLLLGPAFGLAILADRVSLGHGLPSLFCLGAALYSAWVVYRDWPYRPYILLMTMAALAASLTFAEVADRAAFGVWLRGVLTVVWSVAMITGLLDHWLLVTTMRRPAPDGPQAQRG